LLGCADGGFVVHAIGQMRKRKEECVSYICGIKSVTAKKNYDLLCE